MAYVTEHHLQLRYPPGPKAFSTYYSSADLQDSAFVSEPRRYVARGGEFRLVAVGSMAQRYKAYDILLEAFRQCIETHPNLTLTLVGDGRYRPDLQSLASNLCLDGRVTFAGELPGDEVVRRILAESDLLVHSSRAEGLPRVVIEAMAQGLPCIATAVGGTPELLTAEDLVTPADARRLADMIRAVVGDPERLSRMSERNLVRAREYRHSVLQPRRDSLYRHVLQCTAERALATSRLTGFGRGKEPVTTAASACVPHGDSALYSATKRVFDAAGAIVLLAAFLPLLAVVAVLIRVLQGRPVLFFQRRAGLRGRPFNMVKFRTMRPGPGTNEERLTQIGRLLRHFSVDELPELWLVIDGTMSLVGPRPLATEYLGLYSSEQARRHEVKPGITGWAQVNGRNAISWEQKFAFDVWYVDHRSFWLDLVILLRTPLKVLKREGISPKGRATMERFTGCCVSTPDVLTTGPSTTIRR